MNRTDARGLYRVRNGAFQGVLEGLARYFDISVFWTRVVFVLLFVFTIGWPMILAYFIAYLMMKPEPVVAFDSPAEQEFYDSYAHNRENAIGRLQRVFDRIDRRIQRLESRVTSPEFTWEQRMREHRDG